MKGKTMSNSVKDLLNSISKMEYHEITVELYEPLEFRGVVPFDMTIVGDIATFKVLASSFEDANDKVQTFLGR
jgi:hypothetical protein